MPQTDAPEPANEGELPVDRFRGLVLSIVPPHGLSPSNRRGRHRFDPESEREVGTVFLGNGPKWIRANFWGDAADRAGDFLDATPGTVLELRGRLNERNGIADLHVFADDDRTGVERVTWTYRTLPIRYQRARSNRAHSSR